jgi:gag-polypeptide of LTR copia-type
LLKWQGLCEFVETRAPGIYSTPIEIVKRNAKALFFIQQVVVDTVFTKIAAVASVKEAWTTLKIAFQENSKVREIRLQGLRRKFETLNMNQGESVQVFLIRVTSIVNQIKSCGDDLTKKIVVMKVLHNLTSKFDYVVTTIEESKDLSTYSFDELMGPLQTHEVRLLKSEEKDDSNAFVTRGNATRGRGYSGRGRGRGMSNGERILSATIAISSVMSRHIATKRGGRIKTETRLFMTKTDEKTYMIQVWLVDSVCSNHMSRYKYLFEELDETYKKPMRLDNEKEIQVKGISKVAIQTSHNTRFLHNVYCIPQFSQNLLSIGQMMDNEYAIKFEGNTCRIEETSTKHVVTTIRMTHNNSFSLEISEIDDTALAIIEPSQSRSWHLRYGHLIINGLKLLN